MSYKNVAEVPVVNRTRTVTVGWDEKQLVCDVCGYNIRLNGDVEYVPAVWAPYSLDDEYVEIMPIQCNTCGSVHTFGTILEDSHVA